MIRRPPSSTRTDTLFPYTTLFRSVWLHADLPTARRAFSLGFGLLEPLDGGVLLRSSADDLAWFARQLAALPFDFERSEEHTSELQSLMRISYAVFCLQKKKMNHKTRTPKR